MAQVISHILIAVLIPTEVPAELVGRWVNRTKEAAPRTGKGLKKALARPEDFQTKVIKPGLKAFQKLVAPDFISRSGNSVKEMIGAARAKMDRSRRRHHTKIRLFFKAVNGVKAQRFRETIDASAGIYARAIRPLLALTGYKKIIRGVAPLAGRWLTNDPAAYDLLREEDEVKEGGPVLITEPSHQSQFRQRLFYRIRKAGGLILSALDTAFEDFFLKSENDLTNQLVQSYARSEFVPFAPGEPSHLDFVVLPSGYGSSPRMPRVYLDLQVAVK